MEQEKNSRRTGPEARESGRAVEDSSLLSCRDFAEVLASSAPVPGGGGAAALVGAVGTALGHMVGSLTVGKKKYAGVEAELLGLMEECGRLREGLLDQIRGDAEGFAPLAAAYGIPKDDPDRERILEEATDRACAAPLRIMELADEALACVKVFAEKGSPLAVSDAGCAAVCLRAALEAASLNVFVNTRSLKNRGRAEELEARCEALLEGGTALAEQIYACVKEKLGRK